MDGYYRKQYEFNTKIHTNEESLNKNSFPILIANKKFTPNTFCLLTEKNTVNMFFRALQNGSEKPYNYISKGPVNFDVDDIKMYISDNANYKHLIDTNITQASYNYRKNSVLIINESMPNKVLQVYLKREPDSFGDFKIYYIEEE